SVRAVRSLRRSAWAGRYQVAGGASSRTSPRRSWARRRSGAVRIAPSTACSAARSCGGSVRAGAMGVSVIMVVFLSVEWGGSTCLAAGCRPFFVSRVLGVAGAEVSEVGPLIGAYAFELGEKRLEISGGRGDGAHAAGEGFAAVDAASRALVGGLCADVGEVVPEGVGVAAVDPLVDAGDRGAALGGLVADVGDDGLGFGFGWWPAGGVGEAFLDELEGSCLGCGVGFLGGILVFGFDCPLLFFVRGCPRLRRRRGFRAAR